MARCRIAVLLTCFNRKLKTLECLARLEGAKRASREYGIYLVDDASTDGTKAAVSERYPDVKIIDGDGSLFWNGGMRVAFEAAMKGNYDFLLWLNDDTLLYSEAIESLIKIHDQVCHLGKGAIIVGSTQDETSGMLTYGGVIRRRKWMATSFTLVLPSSKPVECETMNGNCVLIPSGIARDIGSLDPAFIHAMGDQDYGLRARAAGYQIWVMPGFAGTCSRNPVEGSFSNTRLPLRVRWEKMLSPKGLPITPWRIFTQRHAGPAWPVFWLWPYIRVVTTSILRKK